MKSFVDKEVLCKRDQSHGLVVAQSSTSVTVETAGVAKEVSWSTFNRWYKVVDEDAEPDDKEALAKAVKREKEKEAKAVVAPAEHKPVEKESEPEESYAIGIKYRASFLDLVAELTSLLSHDKIETFYKPETRTDIVRVNGRNAFECVMAKKKYSILCHPDSLAPETLKRATKLFPKEWGWALRAQYIMGEDMPFTVIRGVVTDGIYYRSKDRPTV